MSATERGGYGKEPILFDDTAEGGGAVEVEGDLPPPSYADIAMERFKHMVNSDVKVSSDISLFVQAVAMDYLRRTHLREIQQVSPEYLDSPYPAAAFFSDAFASIFDREFNDNFGGDLEKVRTAIFSKHDSALAMKEIEKLTEQWWQKKQGE